MPTDPAQILLASASQTRLRMLRNAGVSVEAVPARVDEETITLALLDDGAQPRDIADALAEAKARRVSARHPGRLVLGSDQVLDFQGTLGRKPESRDEAIAQLSARRGKTHSMFSAAVIYDDGEPVWRHVGQVRLAIRDVSDAYLADYADRNWPGISASVGGYKLEEEGARLFHRIDGDYFTVLGLPLLEVLSYLSLRGTIPT